MSADPFDPLDGETSCRGDEADGSLHELRREIGPAIEECGVLVRIQLDRLRVRAREFFWRAAGVALAALATAVVVVVSLVHLVGGMCDGFTVLLGAPWAGAAAGGACGVVLVAGLYFGTRYGVARRGRADLEARYGDVDEPGVERN